MLKLNKKVIDKAYTYLFVLNINIYIIDINKKIAKYLINIKGLI